MLPALPVPVVVADPDPVSALVLAEIIGGTGAAVDVVQDVDVLVRRLAVAPAPAAVVLVAPLPGASLPTALGICAEAVPYAARVALVDQDSPVARISALDAGADIVLALPVHAGELRSALAAVVRRTWMGV
ncbi:hypothetical protein [Blastococcus sp. TF02-09]|uniref:hypothetical protein n=1 Tax=Blastococcus sp. TF02-09 TaxID=2250576 RepID=UPI0013142612|nr:hypothetical protein [Blastococcus sp. TF02-9]